MNPLHQQLLNRIKSEAPDTVNAWVNEKYHGNKHVYYGLSVPQKRKIAKEFLKTNKDTPPKAFEQLITELFHADSFEEKTIAAALLGYFPRKQFSPTPHLLTKCLDCIEGWAEIDSLCYGLLSASEILSHWDEWEIYIQALAKNEDITKRRASLVLLNKAVRESNDTRLSQLSFEVIDQLKSETHILITKAISWVLRDLSRHHKEAVEKYIKNNEDSLPKIAIRETRRKIMTGKKT